MRSINPLVSGYEQDKLKAHQEKINNFNKILNNKLLVVKAYRQYIKNESISNHEQETIKNFIDYYDKLQQ